MEVNSLNGAQAGADTSTKRGKKAATGFAALLATLDAAAKTPGARELRADMRQQAHASFSQPRGLTSDKPMNETKVASATEKHVPAMPHASTDEVADAASPANPALLAQDSAALGEVQQPVPASTEVRAVPADLRAPDRVAGNKERPARAEGLSPTAAVASQRGQAQSSPMAKGLPMQDIAASTDGMDPTKAQKTDKKALTKEARRAEEVAAKPVDNVLPTPLPTSAHVMVAAGAPSPASQTGREVSIAAKERSPAAGRATNTPDTSLLEKISVKDDPAMAPVAAFERYMQAVSDKAALTQAIPAAPYEVTVPVGQQGWSDAISKTMVSMLKDGVTQAVVSINPENLGPVDIKISMEKGTVNVDFFSPYAEVRDALTDGADQLQARFAEAGVKLDRVESHDTLPAMKEDFAQERGSRDEQRSSQQEQRRDPRRENSWLAQVMEDDQEI